MQIPAANRTAQLFDSIDAARNWLDPQGEAPVEPAPARRLAWQMSTIEDRDRLLDYARELDEQATLLEGSIARSA